MIFRLKLNLLEIKTYYTQAFDFIPESLKKPSYFWMNTNLQRLSYFRKTGDVVFYVLQM